MFLFTVVFNHRKLRHFNYKEITTMAHNTILRQYKRGIPLSPAVFLLILIGIAITFTILPTAAAAETDGHPLKSTIVPTEATAEADKKTLSAEEVARELSNPNSSLATLTFKNQYRWYTGDLPGADDQNNYTMLFQPVFPLSLPKDDNGNKANLCSFVQAFHWFSISPCPSVGGRWVRLGWRYLPSVILDLTSLTVSRKKTVSCGPWVWWVPCLLLPIRKCGRETTTSWPRVPTG